MSNPQSYDKKCDNSKNNEKTNTKMDSSKKTSILFYKNDVSTNK